MRMRAVAVAVAGGVAWACSGEVRQPTAPESVSLPLVASPAQHAGNAHNDRTHLSGDQEVFTPSVPGGPSPADSRAQGQAILHIAEDQQSFDYKLIAANIENITQAHIHCGLPGTNGPIIVWLYPGPTATMALPGGAGRHNGVLAEGTVVSGTPLHVRTAASSAQCPGGVSSFADVLTQIRAGNTYVNVHTSDGAAPANTGPGDFPGGEVRGQLD